MINTQIKPELGKEDILKLYTQGCKKPEDFTVGIEYERLPV